MAIIDLFRSQPEYYFVTVIILGLIIGSFLNVVIHRLPEMLKRQWRSDCEDFLHELDENTPKAQANHDKYNLMVPGSCCPKCGHNITILENIPVLSFIFLKAQCRVCKTKISFRYPLVELLSAVLVLIIALQLGVSMHAFAAMLLTWALIVLSFIDFDHQFLPDEITLGFLWLGLIVNAYYGFIPLQDALWGAVIGFLILWLLYHIFKLITGKEGMGRGDFKLLAMLGAWLGWQSLMMIVLISSLTGAIIGITLIALKKQEKGKPIPFGPYLAFAGWIVLLWGEKIKLSYFQYSGITH